MVLFMNTLNLVARGGVAAAFIAIATIHVYWARGGFWPGHDPASLFDAVVGAPLIPGARRPYGERPGPPPSAAMLVAAAFVAASAAVLFGAPNGPLRPLYAALAFVFALRGTVGFADRWIRPATVGSAFARLNVVFYSPLCLALAASLLLLMRTG